jgi:hypothetical protein
MRLFSSDLVRNFSIGFVLGALLVAGANAESFGSQIASPAHAAPMAETLQPTAEFVIAPQQETP